MLSGRLETLILIWYGTHAALVLEILPLELASQHNMNCTSSSKTGTCYD